MSDILRGVISDPAEIRKVHTARSKSVDEKTVSASKREALALKIAGEEADGWEVAKKNKRSVRMTKPKPVDRQLEDDVWCLLYRMGFKEFNQDRLCAIKLGEDYGRIIVAPRRDASLAAVVSRSGWKVSTAVVVEGILRLITSNPRRDTNELRSHGSASRRVLEGKFSDRSPLRDVYLNGNDALIYTMVLNYLGACNAIFWEKAKPDSFIFRTAGVQALFAVLRKLAKSASVAKDISADYFTRRLANAGNIDFSADEFRSSSGAGRSRIRRAIEAAIDV